MVVSPSLPALVHGCAVHIQPAGALEGDLAGGFRPLLDCSEFDAVTPDNIMQAVNVC